MLRNTSGQDARGSTASISVTSDQAVTLSISFAEVKGILGRVLPLGNPATDSLAAQTLQAALKRCQLFSKLPEPALVSLTLAMVPTIYSSGDVVAPAGAAASKLYFLARGALISAQVFKFVKVPKQSRHASDKVTHMCEVELQAPASQGVPADTHWSWMIIIMQCTTKCNSLRCLCAISLKAGTFM